MVHMSKIHEEINEACEYFISMFFCEVVNKFRASLKGQLGPSASIAFFSVIISDGHNKYAIRVM